MFVFIIKGIACVALNIIGSGNVSSACRIIPAVGEHVESQEALSGGGIGVRVDESDDSGIVVTGLEIIDPGLCFSAGAMRPFLTTFR